MSRQSDLDNHANQLNPNNDAFWQSRDGDERPDDGEDRAEKQSPASEKENLRARNGERSSVKV